MTRPASHGYGSVVSRE